MTSRFREDRLKTNGDLRRQLQQGRLEAGPQGVQKQRGSIAQFERDAPYAQYMGQGPEGDIWVERVNDPVTGITITLAYTTNDGGRSAQAWCIDPDMRDSQDLHNCHCYASGEVCTDLHSVRRSLPEKRVRAVLWAFGFANYLKEGRFPLDG